ncbi:Enamine/imine deaminase [Botryosphaeria dothidea]|uniref:Enamine/imine deaminase n=1 Tax=Botryosphaeria dothidea TaxID=55169 RepID=A0A8H4NBH6_9PEZI|nr:Enamine/imine deaminase [Botryosphaeria dothidea]
MTDKIVPIHTPESVAPIGPYSQAVKANGLVFVSGMIPATKDGKLVEGSVSEQTHQMCRNAQAVLGAAGSGLEKAVKITVFFANLDDFAEMNGVYAEYFPHRPARSAIEAKRLPAGVPMEMDIIAIE